MRGGGGGGGGGSETSKVEIPMSSNQAYTTVGGVRKLQEREQTYEAMDGDYYQAATGGGERGREGQEQAYEGMEPHYLGEEQEAIYEHPT